MITIDQTLIDRAFAIAHPMHIPTCSNPLLKNIT